MGKKQTVSLEDKFWSFVDKKGEDNCWEWTGNLFKQGYGRMYHHSTKEPKAHRLSYMINIGNIPEGLLVCHICNNKSCVNPKHLYVGTNQDNSDDMKNSGRSLTGEKASASKLKEEEVLKIRELFAKSERSLEDLGYQFNISAGSIHAIVTGLSWKHVGGPVTKLNRGKKLNPKKAFQIRELFSSGDYTFKKLGELFGVSYVTIGGVVYGKYWKNAGGPIAVRRNK